jgi:hypothetical protein
MALTVLEICAGAGGQAIGLEAAGIELSGAMVFGMTGKNPTSAKLDLRGLSSCKYRA